MFTANTSEVITIGGTSFRGSTTFTDEGQIGQAPPVVVGQSGSLSARTGNTEGTATLGANHGITTGLLVDLYWTGGSRRGVTVGTVAGTSVPFSLGSGDNLPTQGDAITVSPVTVSMLRFDAEDMKFLAYRLTQAGKIVFLDDTDTELFTQDLSANYIHRWDDLSGYANPIADDSSSFTSVYKIRVSTSYTSTTAPTFNIGVLVNTIPA